MTPAGWVGVVGGYLDYALGRLVGCFVYLRILVFLWVTMKELSESRFVYTFFLFCTV